MITLSPIVTFLFLMTQRNTLPTQLNIHKIKIPPWSLSERRNVCGNTLCGFVFLRRCFFISTASTHEHGAMIPSRLYQIVKFLEIKLAKSSREDKLENAPQAGAPLRRRPSSMSSSKQRGRKKKIMLLKLQWFR
ncbi:hypothetical protein F4815DRAFT_120857 [Daldinia loculata]|nr:hypothetical protein F4815DRAFT_120857 [Daldinia loculata]